MTTEVVDAPKVGVKRKDHFKGTVKKLTLAGGVIELGLDRPGFLHITQLGDKSIKKIDDALTVGQEIDVWVRRPVPSKPFIELTIREPLGMEWRDIRKGITVHGIVSKIERFGAFVEIGAERPGLVHVSEMTHDYVRNPEDVVKVGDDIEAKVLDFDRRKKQIKLSMKALIEKPAAILKAMNQESAFDNSKPVPTAMEFALRKAQDREKAEEKKEKAIKSKANSMDDILTRTLEGYEEEK